MGRWGNRVEELVALCSSSIVSKAAYEAAAKLKPGANLVLAHRARIIARLREDKPAADVVPERPVSAKPRSA